MLLALLLAAAAAAPAQGVYRCGPEGREYRQTPCPGGQAVDAADPRSEEQRREAAQLTQREATLAQSLRRDREAQVARTARQTRSQASKAQPQRQAEGDAPPAAKPRGKHRRDLGPAVRRAWAPKAAEPEAPKKQPDGKRAEKQPS
ncbi:hypothetical protein [Azohydromonas caseinilytica]|uniref:DUF4124 domain-containing protein n=1 Tax=Azohydromonas caseinilytica TaxID=2728836 RepID=A0A848F1W8_9BURK|nr:hypothetical protein [Azohydromonas caseinilytica]NML13402.1 hypothetical protein [Azohydromonas caseinilytica]